MDMCRSIAIALLSVAIVAHGADKKPLSRSESLQLNAVVESVDAATRTLVLKGDGGARIEVVAGPDVRNFDRVKAGDRIMLTYLIGVAVELKPRGTPVTAPIEATSERRSPAEQPPGMAVGRTVVATVKIESVDTSFNTVTFKRSDGITRVLAVEDPEAQRFIHTLKPGDVVEVTYSEATAVSLEPAARS